ncbi:gamma-glutamyl-gamma-aminobutyrate hydrolase family protein [Thermoleophilia bacterium SCSIO 60948]|nr:gamma-glutamyl-gamma-aminobutyrate hydrolase family protein [Thermoleophilia bacterium SCSIO 60948]
MEERDEAGADRARTPRIAMLADRREASFGAWRDVSLGFVWTHYVEAVARAGGAPVVVPATDLYASRPELALEAVDGLLLTGGRDIDPELFGGEHHPEAEAGDLGRDRIEAAIARSALDRGLPVLGVCRGMQLLNVIRGGGLEPHLSDPDGIHRGEVGSFVAHDVDVEPDSLAADALGSGRVVVRSHHHQGVGELGSGLVASARAPDGVVEALEDPEAPWCLAVLWHPEEDLETGGLSLYRSFVEAARSRTEVEG